MKRNLRRILGLGLSILMLASSGCFSKKKQKETGASASSEISSREENIVLNKGKIIEQGNHKSLIEENGYYAKLYNAYYNSLL